MGMAELNSTQLDSDRFYFFAFSNSTRIEIGSSATLTCVKRERRGKGYNLTTEPKCCQILTVKMICGKTLHLIKVCGARFCEVLRACGLRSRAGADSRTSETCNVARVGSSQVTISIALEVQAQLLTSSGQDTWRHCFDCRKGR